MELGRSARFDQVLSVGVGGARLRTLFFFGGPRMAKVGHGGPEWVTQGAQFPLHQLCLFG